MAGALPSGAPDGAATTLHVRRARAGDAASVAWLVERFTPVLLAQARYRLGSSLAREVDAEDLVQDVWAVALPALPALEPRGDRDAPTLAKFLSTTLVHRVNDLLRRAIRRGLREAGTAASPSRLPDSAAGAWTRAVRSEEAGALARCLEELPAADREVVVLRAFEQLPNHRVAALVGATPNATSLRYNRALAALRERLPGSIVEELARPDLPDAAADPGAPTPENPRNP